MMRGLDIPKIYLYKPASVDQYDCIDGRQRIESIIEFFDGYLNLPDGRNWEKLDKKEKEIMTTYDLTIALITQAKDEELRLLFLRLQLGAPLNVGEKLHAMKGQIRDFVFETAKCDPFLAEVKIPYRRFVKETVFAQICINSFYRSLYKTFSSARYEELRFFFENFADLTPYQQQKEQVLVTMKEMNQYFGKKASNLRNRAIIVSAYLYFEELLIKKQDDKLVKFTEFFLKFVDTLTFQAQKGFEYDPEYREILDFQTLIIQAAVSKSAIEDRHKMLKEYFEYYLIHNEIRKTKAIQTTLT
jgi:hypothetical protein